MSPEMLTVGTSHETATSRPPDGQSDVWSLGCLLYELITGLPLFDDSNYSDFYALLSSNSYVPLVGKVQQDLIPCEVKEEVMICLNFILVRNAKLRPPIDAVIHWMNSVVQNNGLPYFTPRDIFFNNKSVISAYNRKIIKKSNFIQHIIVSYLII